MSVPRTDFSPADLAEATDPYALLASVRSQGPVVRSQSTWLVLAYEEASAILGSGKARTGFIAELYRGILPPGAAREEMGNRINFLDPPEHTRIRKLFSKAFTPRRIAALRPSVEEISRELLEGLSQDAPLDLISAFTHQVPSRVISELLGVPLEDRDRMTGLADCVSGLLGLGGLSTELLTEAVAAAEELHGFLRALLDERRRAPKDDLLSALLVAKEDHDVLTESQMMSLAATLYSAGHRTTRDLFTNGLSALLSDKALASKAAEGDIPLEAVVEEFLRYETPTHYVARMLDEPMEIGGVEIPSGEPIAIVLAAANRDPSAYADPDRFDPLRWTQEPAPPPPLSFAIGPHYCLGANLARLEAEVMLETLLAMYPSIRLAEDKLKWWHTGLFRGLESLPVYLGSLAHGEKT